MKSRAVGMAREHTQGEWLYEKGDPGYPGSREEPPDPGYPPFIWVDTEHGEIELAQGLEPIYRVEPVDEYDDGTRYLGSADANMRLMAAAPRLLEALVQIEDLAVRYGNTTGAVPAGRLLRITRAVIAEAEEK